MLPVRIEGCTRVLGAPANWDPDRDGHCGGLAIRDEAEGPMPLMVSAWEPTPAELAALNSGGRVMLRLVGVGHPPVMIWAEPSPPLSTT